MADLWDQLIKKYPRYTIAILLVYALLVSTYTIYSSVRSYYIELKKPYFEDLAEACANISEIAARISRSKTYQADKVEDFWSYYWGRLVLFEDDNLARKMIDYGNLLDTIDPSNYSENKQQLQRRAYAISGACRELIKSIWGLSITPWSDLPK
jgi:hypothetical protein